MRGSENIPGFSGQGRIKRVSWRSENEKIGDFIPTFNNRGLLWKIIVLFFTGRMNIFIALVADNFKTNQTDHENKIL
jgi:hypothetical protein